MRPVATTTAWGEGTSLSKTLERMSADPEIDIVELSIGSRPVSDPAEVLARYPFSYIAHHTAPLLKGGYLRPTTHTPHQAAAALRSLGISRYTIHPPTRKQATPGQMLDWSWDWFDTLGQAGIDVRVETMYVPRDRQERQRSGGYNLSTPAEVFDFCHQAQSRGFNTPLLVDVSHLYIGYCGGAWSGADVRDLLAAKVSDHLHISANDGRTDSHVVAPKDHLVLSWVRHGMDSFLYVVDEARRRPPRATGFAYWWYDNAD